MTEYGRQSKSEQVIGVVAIVIICGLLAFLMLQPILRSYSSFKNECDARGGVIIHRTFVDACESRLD